MSAPVEIPGLVVIDAGPGWVAVDKPAGLLSVPGKDTSMPNVADYVRQVFPDAEAPHRLDMDTSGVMIVATDRAAVSFLSRGFADRKTLKEYVAIVIGHVPKDSGTIDLPIGKDWEARPRQKIDFESGKPSISEFEVLQRGPGDFTRLKLAPRTGRTHQLRVHTAAIGHPIVGDRLYGPPDDRPDRRLLLHARSLTFWVPPARPGAEPEQRTVVAEPPF